MVSGGKKAGIHGSFSILFAALGVFTVCYSASAQLPKDPKKYDRAKTWYGKSSCPPEGILEEYYWDDGKNDLTVNVECVAAVSDGYYKTIRVTQSSAYSGIFGITRHRETLIAAPDGAGAIVDSGHC